MDTWPANSSDLNPIEQIWSIVKRELMFRKINTIDELQKEIVEIWNGIPSETIIGLIQSVKYRM